MNLRDLNDKAQAAFGARFERVVRFTHVDVDSDEESRAKVRYEMLDLTALNILRGVYVIVLDEEDAVYVGSFNCGLAKRWFYTRGSYVYHHQAHEIANALSRGNLVSLHLLAEDTLLERSPADLREYVNVIGVEAGLRRNNEFIWNGTE